MLRFLTMFPPHQNHPVKVENITFRGLLRRISMIRWEQVVTAGNQNFSKSNCQGQRRAAICLEYFSNFNQGNPDLILMIFKSFYFSSTCFHYLLTSQQNSVSEIYVKFQPKIFVTIQFIVIEQTFGILENLLENGKDFEFSIFDRRRFSFSLIF